MQNVSLSDKNDSNINNISNNNTSNNPFLINDNTIPRSAHDIIEISSSSPLTPIYDDTCKNNKSNINDILNNKSPSISNYHTPLTYTTTNTHHQRTISLPQLPQSRLIYEDFNENNNNYMYLNIPIRSQNDQELLNLTGSTTKTLNSNKLIQLPIYYSNSTDSLIINQPTTNDDVYSISSLTPDYYYNNNNNNNNSSPMSYASSSNENHTLHNSKKRFTTNTSNNNNIVISNNNELTNVSSKKQKRLYFQKNIDHFLTDKNDGHYIYNDNDIFANGKFLVKSLLGQGTFGKVLKCKILSNNNYVAIKVIKAIDRYREAAKTELRILNTISKFDPTGSYQCLLLLDYFDYKDHICFVTNLFGKSIYDFMCSNGIPRFPGSHVQAIARQLIRAVCFLHDLGIIHTDLKPENILLINENTIDYTLNNSILKNLSQRRKLASNGKRKILTDPSIKVIDFGSAIFYDEYHPPIISTRHYRAPEIVLGLGWSFPCDVWSIGCVLVELVTGESLYPIHENLEHMAMMERVNGKPFPQKLIDKMFYKISHKLGNIPSDLNSTVVRHFNKNNLSLQWPEKNKNGDFITTEKSLHRVIDGCSRLDNHISKKLKLDYGNWLNINWNQSPENNWNSILNKKLSMSTTNNYNDLKPLDKDTFLFWYWFVDLCRKMFEFDPTKRITVKEALQHEWFNLGILDQGIENYGKSY